MTNWVDILWRKIVHLLLREVCLYPLWVWLLWLELFAIIAVILRWRL